MVAADVAVEERSEALVFLVPIEGASVFAVPLVPVRRFAVGMRRRRRRCSAWSHPPTVPRGAPSLSLTLVRSSAEYNDPRQRPHGQLFSSCGV